MKKFQNEGTYHPSSVSFTKKSSKIFYFEFCFNFFYIVLNLGYKVYHDLKKLVLDKIKFPIYTPQIKFLATRSKEYVF